MTTAAFIPARGGSKGIPRKNLAAIGGESLVARAIGVARAAPGIDIVVVSSEDDEILDEARRCGATTDVRPARLATDDAPTAAVLAEFLERSGPYERVVLLQPTSPLRAVEDIVRCLDALEVAPAAATVMRSRHPVEWTLRVGADDRGQAVFGWEALQTRRQDLGETVQLNGAVYAASTAHLLGGGRFVGPETVLVEMPMERSIDIDTETDLALARFLAE